MSNTEVLVVGAGPTGLALAADLARRGIKVRIVDKNSARSDKSKAIGVQAGTLESLENNFGKEIVTGMIAAGHSAREAFVHVDGLEAVRADLTVIQSKYNFILILSQSETEKFLEQQLNSYGIHVEWQRELISLQDQGAHVTARIRDGAGAESEVTADYTVGCDGAHSAVRREMGFEFRGGIYDGNFVLADGTIEWEWPYDSIHVFVSEVGAMACFPMKGNHKYRLIMIPKGFEGTPDSRNTSESAISLEEVQRLVFKLAFGKVKILDSVWLSRFRVHHRMVEKFQKGRVFLAGDAAHIHSPAGGQGMNTGIQDALNLSYRLAQVLREGAPEDLLKCYEKDRFPIAKKVVRYTDLPMRLALLPENTMTRKVRRFVFPKLVGAKWIQRRVVRAISEVGVARREIAERKNQLV